MNIPERPALTDTHCHLDFKHFESDLDEVVARARDAGLVRVLNPGVDLSSSRIALRLADSTPEIYAAVGIHPNSALTWNERTLDELKHLAEHPKVVAIGEIGLDYYRDRAPRALQQHVFRQQLSLAASKGLPVVLHNRQASPDMLTIIKEWYLQLEIDKNALAERPGVFHSYAGDEISIRQVSDLNFWVGITGPVTFKNASNLQRIVAELPMDRILIETDAPYLTPHPYRGERNEPAQVRLVAGKIAELQRQPFEVVAEVTTANAGRLFNWREIG